jgi:hypothetical protein
MFPAAPKTEKEADEQKRAEYVGERQLRRKMDRGSECRTILETAAALPVPALT